ncbi:MAG: M48 family metalloprotease [Halioglobus sp.]|nr:M48 family metalloprotease [Halioglobus sp.]
MRILHTTALTLMAIFPVLAALPGCAGSASTGREMHQEMITQGAAYDDPELQAYVNRVGQRLVASSDEPDMAFTFTVADSPDINAFALPGGYIYINRGLLAYLENEAELAGVLSHEIGHVTASHHSRQQAASVANKVVATTTYVLTGSGDLANASNMYGTELVSGYGREMELEADGLGAEYMYNAGYDPESLLEVIGALKDQEQFQRVKAKAGGKPVATYHGLYATHPRNDQRLKEVIKTAGELDASKQVEDPSVPGEFQRQIEGLVWGESVPSDRSEDRYYHNKLSFTFERPPNWSVNAGAKAIVASAPDGSSELTITVRRRDQGATPRAVLESSVSGALSAGAELNQAGLTGYTGITGSGAGAHRVAVIDYNNLSYLFDGEASNFAADDSALLAMIESFRPMHPAEHGASNGLYVHYIQVPQGATMASLASGVRIPDAEAQLRLLNGLYPRGEPRTGDWIKVIR